MPTWLRIAIVVALVVTLPIIAIVLVIAGVGSGGDSNSGPPTAAIVDQLSVTAPNPDFATSVTATLEAAGYKVDYYPGEDVTVDFYRQLPYHDYDVIVFRSHADRLKTTDPSNGQTFDQVVLFTSEPYSTEKYQNEQNDRDLTIVRYSNEGEPFFGVAAGFIKHVGHGFDGAKIIMMGCEGLLSDTTAQAFIDRGAETYISWDETVTAVHTDAATEVLLQHLLVDGQSPQAAVDQTMAEEGPDPVYGSELKAYPAGG